MVTIRMVAQGFRLIVLTLLLLANSWASAAGPRAKALNKFDAVDLQGICWNLDTMKGKVVLLEFWGTWCGGCIEDHKELRKVLEQYKERRFVILGIAFDSMDRQRFLTWLYDHKITWSQILEQDGLDSRLRSLFDVSYFPSYMLVDREGKVSCTHRGPVRWKDDSFVTSIRTLCER